MRRFLELAVTTHRRTIVVALGGNAVLREGQSGTVDEQLENCRASAKPLVELAKRDCDVAIVHGNGPEVGNLLLRSEIARDVLPPSPLDVCGAQSQGSLGYLIQMALRNALQEERIPRQVCTVLTHTVVDPKDPAFQNPTKPIGPFYQPPEALDLQRQYGWTMKEDAGRGYRRVVPSPRPVDFEERQAISRLLRQGHIVICCGGGGVPVAYREDGSLVGVEAVIDKDLAAARLALSLEADTLLILTAVEKVYVNFNTPQQTALDSLSVDQARAYYEAGEFPPGSMGPKILAAIDFLEGGGRRAIITSPERALEALEGRAGTQIWKDQSSLERHRPAKPGFAA